MEALVGREIWGPRSLKYGLAAGAERVKKSNERSGGQTNQVERKRRGAGGRRSENGAVELSDEREILPLHSADMLC